MMNPLKVALIDPVIFNGVTYSDLTFPRKMTMRDMIAMDAVEGPTQKTCALYASLCGVPAGVFYDMSMADAEQVALAVAAIAGKSEAAREGA